MQKYHHFNFKLTSIIALFSVLVFVIVIEEINAQSDLNKKYKRVDFFMIYEDEKKSSIDGFLANVNLEQMKYEKKETAKIPKIKQYNETKTKSYHIIDGSFTFIDDEDGEKFKQSILPSFNAKDVVYAKMYYLNNSHHWINPEPDKILEDIEVGVSIETIP